MGTKHKIYCIMEEKEISTEKCMDCPDGLFPCVEFSKKFKVKTEEEVEPEKLDKCINIFLDQINR